MLPCRFDVIMTLSSRYVSAGNWSGNGDAIISHASNSSQFANTIRWITLTKGRQCRYIMSSVQLWCGAKRSFYFIFLKLYTTLVILSTRFNPGDMRRNKNVITATKWLCDIVLTWEWHYYVMWSLRWSTRLYCTLLTHFPLDKMDAISQTTYLKKMHEWKCLYFDSSFTEVCYYGSNWQ